MRLLKWHGSGDGSYFYFQSIVSFSGYFFKIFLYIFFPNVMISWQSISSTIVWQARSPLLFWSCKIRMSEPTIALLGKVKKKKKKKAYLSDTDIFNMLKTSGLGKMKKSVQYGIHTILQSFSNLWHFFF